MIVAMGNNMWNLLFSRFLFVVGIIIVILPTPNAAKDTKQRLTAELIIVCDKGFGDQFHHDSQKINDYWAAKIWDTNMRFKTLNKVDINFRITQLLTFKETAEQPFIEKARTTDGFIIAKQAYPNFAEWLYASESNLTKFDIAVLVTSSDWTENANSYTYSQQLHTACQKSTKLKMHLSSAMIKMKSPWGSACSTLEQSLARLLGAPVDADTGKHDGCAGHDLILSTNSGVCGRGRFFFSRCSDTGISEYTSGHEANCLRTLDTPDKDIASMNAKVSHPPSIQKQCGMLVNNSRGTIVATEDAVCVAAKCYIPKNGLLKYVRTFYPIDNSPCGDNKFCFRGRCLSKGYQIRNVESGLCLQGSDRFASNDLLKTVQCTKVSTPLDQFRISEVEPYGIFLATPYSTPDSRSQGDKFLSLELKKEHLQYAKCSNGSLYWLGWNFVRVDGANAEFLLFHPFTKLCAGAQNGNLTLSLACNEKDKWMRWSFVEKFDILPNWLKSKDVLQNNMNGNFTNLVSKAAASTESTSIKSVACPATSELQKGDDVTGRSEYDYDSFYTTKEPDKDVYITTPPSRKPYGISQPPNVASSSGWGEPDLPNPSTSPDPLTSTECHMKKPPVQKWDNVMPSTLIIFGIVYGMLLLLGIMRLWKSIRLSTGETGEYESVVVYTRGDVSLNFNGRNY